MELLLKSLPEDMSKLKVDLEYPNRTLINGCYEQTIIINGMTRSFITYIPEEIENCRPCIVIAPPSKTETLKFLEHSGFKQIADEKKFFIFLLAPQMREWDISGLDADFMNAVYAEIQSRDYYVTMQDNIYACGIEDGADIAQQAAQKMASEWSGLFTIGDLTMDIAKNVFESTKSNDQGEVELLIEAQQSQLPVWMSFNTMDGANAGAVSYWKEQNKVTEDYLSGQGADYIWMPSPIRRRSEINEEMIAQVRVSLGKTSVSYDLIQTIWKYIGTARRHRGQGRKNLRYYKDAAVCGAVARAIEIDEMKRTWYEYIPEDCTPDMKWPLVVVMHGRGGTADTFFDISCMSVVAQERKFIAVYPQAGIYQQKEKGLKNVLLWDGALDDKPIDDVKFIRAMVQDIINRIPVDKGRIYACGQSSGGMMTDILCDSASDIFAATASWSALTSPSRMYMQHEKTKGLTPTMFIYGDHDFLCAGKEPDLELPFCAAPEIKSTILDKIKRCGLKKENVRIWKCNPITWYVFPNKQGVPMLTVGVVENMIHANYPEESWISYDQFFCQFSRDEEGKLCYRGTVVEENER